MTEDNSVTSRPTKVRYYYDGKTGLLQPWFQKGSVTGQSNQCDPRQAPALKGASASTTHQQEGPSDGLNNQRGQADQRGLLRLGFRGGSATTNPSQCTPLYTPEGSAIQRTTDTSTRGGTRSAATRPRPPATAATGTKCGASRHLSQVDGTSSAPPATRRTALRVRHHHYHHHPRRTTRRCAATFDHIQCSTVLRVRRQAKLEGGRHIEYVQVTKSGGQHSECAISTFKHQQHDLYGFQRGRHVECAATFHSFNVQGSSTSISFDVM